MHTTPARATLGALLAVAMVAISPAILSAAEGDDLAKQVGEELRTGTGNVINGKLPEAKANLAKAQELLGKLKAADPNHRQIKTLDSRVASLEAGVSRLAARVERNTETPTSKPEPKPVDPRAEEWNKKLRLYTTPDFRGGDKQKYLIPSATEAQADMAARMRIFGEATGVMEEYKKAALTAKTDELQEAETNLEKALKQFADSCREYAKRYLEESQRDLQHAADFLTKQEAKKGGPDDMPLTLQKDQLSSVMSRLNWAAALLPADDAKLAELRKSLGEIQERDAKLRKVRIGQTKMRPEQYKGDDAKAIRDKAEEIAKKKYASGKVLKSKVVGAAWVEQTVLEPTDTTHTAVRVRTFRSVTAQVAVKAGEGDEAALLTLDIYQNKQSDGAWAALDGHIMFTDPMLEKSVD